MAPMALEEVAAAAQELPRDEQARLLEMLKALWEQSEEKAKRDQILQKMLEDGLITRIPPPIMDGARHRSWKPIEIEGKPISETIIEERR
jgi:hypothetical protein